MGGSSVQDQACAWSGSGAQERPPRLPKSVVPGPCFTGAVRVTVRLRSGLGRLPGFPGFACTRYHTAVPTRQTLDDVAGRLSWLTCGTPACRITSVTQYPRLPDQAK